MLGLHRRLAKSFCHPISREALARHGISTRHVFRNLTPAKYYETALNTLPANPNTIPSCYANNGAFVAYSGEKTGRSPQDKRIVRPQTKEEDEKVWWSHVNKPMERAKFEVVLQRAIDYLNNRDKIYVVDGFVGWDPKIRKSVRVFTTREYHGIFMHNMMIRPTEEELRKCFEKPDYVIYNAGEFYAEKGTTSSSTSRSRKLPCLHGHRLQRRQSRHPRLAVRRRDEEGAVLDLPLHHAGPGRALAARLGHRRARRRYQYPVRSLGHRQNHAEP
jgi:Phosphoenolpyruvate carboxykinase